MKKRNIAIAVAGAAGAAVAVKMFTRRPTVQWDDVETLVPHSDRSSFINVDGIRLHYQQFGIVGKPVILLIHGYTASVYVWKTAAPLLAKAGFNVVAIDLVGFGYSEKPRWFDYSISSQARITARFLDRLGIGCATMVGSSYGGAIAATLALDYPARVEKLVLVDAVINDELKSHPILRLVSIPGIGEALTPFLADSKALLRHRMHLTLAKANHHLIDDQRIANIMRPLSAADGHHSLLATSRNWHADRIEHDAHLISQPTLLVWGEEDNLIPLENGRKLLNAILHSRMVVFRNCGHVPQEEKSLLFSEIVTEFCRDRKGRIEMPQNEDARLEPAS